MVAESIFQRQGSLTFDSGHVLFVGLAPDDAKVTANLDLIGHAIEHSDDYQEAWQAKQVLLSRSQTGFAVAFTDDPTVAVRFAKSLRTDLKNRGLVDFAVGVHTGPLYAIKDMAMTETVAGAAVNVARRLVEAAKSGSVLVSNSAKEAPRLEPYWTEQLQPVGDCQIREGKSVPVYSLGYGELLPDALATAERVRPTTDRVAAGKRIVLVYKRRCPMCEYVLLLLERKLQEAGHDVFVDRKLRGGMEWAGSIQRAIEAADVFIPLVSLSSMISEQVLLEVEHAYEHSAKTGKPITLPIRIGYEAELPSEMGKYLDHLQYLYWEESADDQHLVTSALNCISDIASGQAVVGNGADNQPRTQMPPSVSHEAVGGAMPINSPFYIARAKDAVFYAALEAKDSIVLAKGSRQMGKTSLLARGIDRVRTKGFKVAVTDFQKLTLEDLSSANNLLKALAESLFFELDLDIAPSDVWRNEFGPNRNFERYLKRVLETIDGHLVWAMDEADRLMVTDFGSEIFGLFRSWHNDRALNPTGPYSKLTQAFAYATEAQLFIRDLNQSPFNVGTHLTLDDFNLDEVSQLNDKYGQPLKTSDEVQALMKLVGGNPFLVRKALFTISVNPMTLEHFEEHVAKDDGQLADHLKRILILLSRDPELTEELKLVLKGGKTEDPDSFYRLRSAGVLAGDTPSEPRIRCELYARYLSRHLLD